MIKYWKQMCGTFSPFLDNSSSPPFMSGYSLCPSFPLIDWRWNELIMFSIHSKQKTNEGKKIVPRRLRSRTKRLNKKERRKETQSRERGILNLDFDNKWNYLININQENPMCFASRSRHQNRVFKNFFNLEPLHLQLFNSNTHARMEFWFW